MVLVLLLLQYLCTQNNHTVWGVQFGSKVLHVKFQLRMCLDKKEVISFADTSQKCGVGVWLVLSNRTVHVLQDLEAQCEQDWHHSELAPLPPSCSRSSKNYLQGVISNKPMEAWRFTHKTTNDQTDPFGPKAFIKCTKIWLVYFSTVPVYLSTADNGLLDHNNLFWLLVVLCYESWVNPSYVCVCILIHTRM